MLRLLLAVGLLSTFVGAASASGSGSVRNLTSTSFRACPEGGRLMEHYFVTGDAQAYGEDVAIVCLKDATSAVWVFESSAYCPLEPSKDDEPARCHELAAPREHMAADGGPPAIVTYEIVGYDVGEDCHLVKDKVVAELDWSCRTTRAYPKMRRKVVVTGPAMEVPDVRADAAKLPFAIRPVPR